MDNKFFNPHVIQQAVHGRELLAHVLWSLTPEVPITNEVSGFFASGNSDIGSFQPPHEAGPPLRLNKADDDNIEFIALACVHGKNSDF